MTLNDLLTASLRALGLLHEAQVPSAAMIANAQMALNVNLQSLGNTVIYANTTEILNLVAGQASYTIGDSASANFNTVRPDQIKEASFVRDSDNIDYDLEVWDAAKYNLVDLKTTESIPYAVWYDPQYPFGVLTFYYVPDKAYELHLVSQKPLAAITALYDPIAMPPQFIGYVKWVTAEALAAEYPGAMAQPGYAIVVREATRVKMLIQRINAANSVEQPMLDIPGKKRLVDDRGLFLSGK